MNKWSMQMLLLTSTRKLQRSSKNRLFYLNSRSVQWLKVTFHGYGVSGYPTLKFFLKSNKAGEDYEGERDVCDFANFINEKCGTSRDAKGQLSSKDDECSYFVHPDS